MAVLRLGGRVSRGVGRGVARERGRSARMRRWSIALAMAGSYPIFDLQRSPEDAALSFPWSLRF